MALFSCPHCAWRVKIAAEDLGKKGKCIQCGQGFVFPSTLVTEVPSLPKKPVAPPQSSRARRMRGWKWAVALSIVAVAVAGVPAILIWSGLDLRDSPKPAVFGKVRYKNQPLSGGAISFIGENGFFRSNIDKDGSYQVNDCPPGPVKVSVRSVAMSLKKQKGDKVEWIVKSLIPTKYNDPKTSGLTYTIGGDRQQINIDLKD